MTIPFLIPVTLVVAALTGSGTPMGFAQAENAAIRQTSRADIISVDTLLKKKSELSEETFDCYWTNVHAPLATAALGFDEYWTHRFEPMQPDLFPNQPGLNYDLPAAEQFSGTAQVTLNTAPRMQALFQNPGTPLILEDEQNVFSQSKPLIALPGNSLLLKNEVESNATLGRNTRPTYQVYFQKADSTSVEAFRKFLKESFAPTFAASKALVKVNLHLMEPYQETAWPSPHVDHHWDSAKQYQAYLEIVFADSGATKAFFQSAAYQATQPEQLRQLKAIHVYPVRETYTFMTGGKPTLAGMRGAATAGVILQVNARNQLREDVLKQTVNAKLMKP